MNTEERNHVYREVEKLNAGWACDSVYEDMPGVPDIPLFIRDLFEMTMGDELEMVRYPMNDWKKPKEWYRHIKKIGEYVGKHMKVGDRFDETLSEMLDCLMRMMRKEFGWKSEDKNGEQSV